MKTYCLCGGVNDGLANFCGKCGKSLSGQITKTISNARTAAPPEPDDDDEKDDYEEYLKFKKARKTDKKSYARDEEYDDIEVPELSQLKVRVNGGRKDSITLGSIINTAAPSEGGDFSRPRNNVDVNSFMKQRAEWISKRNEIEV